VRVARLFAFIGAEPLRYIQGENSHTALQILRFPVGHASFAGARLFCSRRSCDQVLVFIKNCMG
jgi:hypothetical protein